MNRFRSGKSLSPIRQVEAYWNALRDGGTVPRRRQIDPRGLEPVLQYAFVLERIAPGIARFRLAGQHLSQLAGMEARGMPVTAFFTPASRNRIGAVLEHVFDAPAVAELTLTARAKHGRSPIEARMILLPLKSDQGVISRILGVLISDEDHARVPLRLEVRETELRPVSARGKAPDRATQAATGFAEAQTVLGGRAPHLRLVKSEG